MNLVPKSSWSESVGKFIKSSKKKHYWTFEFEKEPIDVVLSVSKFSGKQVLSVNSREIGKEKHGMCGQDCLSGEFRQFSLQAVPLSDGEFELYVDGLSFRKLVELHQSRPPTGAFPPKKGAPPTETRGGLPVPSAAPRPPTAKATALQQKLLEPVDSKKNFREFYTRSQEEVQMSFELNASREGEELPKPQVVESRVLSRYPVSKFASDVLQEKYLNIQSKHSSSTNFPNVYKVLE